MPYVPSQDLVNAYARFMTASQVAEYFAPPAPCAPADPLTPAERMIESAEQWLPEGGLGNLVENLTYGEAATIFTRIWGYPSPQMTYLRDRYGLDR
jgi:hypothetical protein